jgi:acyl-coenzyme A synthetase/AMP-(fatty) acid ligase
MDDIIKSRGEKVAPKEVENTFMNLPGVKEVAVIGVPDQILGQAIKAFVVLETNALPRCQTTAAALRRQAGELYGSQSHRICR